MKTLTEKQKSRLEKKKKKSAALAQIVKLNDQDEIINFKKNRRSSLSLNSSSTDQTNKNLNEFKDKINEQQHNNSEIEYDQPKCKKIKLEIDEYSNSNNIDMTQTNKNKKKKKKKKEEEETTTTTTTTKKNKNLNNDDHNKVEIKISDSCNDTVVVNDSNEKSNNQITSGNKQEGDNEDVIYMTEREAKQRSSGRRGPALRLKELGEYAQLSITDECRIPLLFTDIQNLMTTLIGCNESPFSPSRWFYFERQSKLTQNLVLIVEGISLFHYLSYEENFKECNRIFNHKFEVVMPPYKDGRIIEELASIPITNSHRDELIKKHGSLEAAIQLNKDSLLLKKTLFPIDSQQNSDDIVNQNQQQEQQKEHIESPMKKLTLDMKNDNYSRIKLLLSVLQMVEEGYPLPLNGALANKYRNYVFTKDSYSPVTDTSPMFGIDCEMCRTITGVHELTRISIVDEDLKPIYETLVRPTNKIVDYLTEYSGITAEMMMNVTKSLNEVQNDVRKIIPSDAILVGQSLNSDLHAMKMMHPYVIDTSVIYNLTGDRRKKTKLQILAKQFLDEMIQVHGDGHDSLEDSRASMKLTQLKLANTIDYGDQVLQLKRKSNEYNQNQSQSQVNDNLLNYVVKNDKRTAIITSKDISSNLEEITYKEINNKKMNFNDKNAYNLKNKNDNDNNENLHFYKMTGNKIAIRKTQEIMNDYDLTISNINIPTDKLELSRIEKTVKNVDKWIGKLWESVSNRGLFIVIFGGAPGSTSGVVMTKIKKNFKSDVKIEIPE